MAGRTEVKPATHGLRFAWSALARVTPLCLAWVIVILVFQAVVPMRLQIRRPDFAVSWTEFETAFNSQDGKIYLVEPFMNAQVSWDSEYYLSIAVAGYEDPAMRRITNPFNGDAASQNYAFFPLYPLLIKLLMLPLGLFGLTPIATATLAGVIVAALGTLVGAAALYDLARPELDEDGALRAVFYLLIFPTGFFLVMVYTEGVFIAIAFWALALMRRGQWGWASLLALAAPWARAQGAVLALPLAVAWLRGLDRSRPLGPQLTPRFWLQGLAALGPIASFAVWRLGPMGQAWKIVQDFWFRRGLLYWEQAATGWGELILYAQDNSQALIYAGLEIGTVVLALGTALWLLRRQPEAALFSLGVVIMSVLSGQAQSMARYMLVAPAMYLVLARLGRSAVFDRAWTTISVLLLGMGAMLFAFDMWVG
jgi:hypothetical protein